MASEQRYPIRVIDRTVALLRCFTPDEPELTLADLASRAGISRPTAYRLLSCLVYYRFLQQDAETRRYRLGLGLFELGQLVFEGLNLVEVARPSLEQLAKITGETAYLAVMDDGMAMYVAKVEGSFAMRLDTSIGARHPCHCSALGKVLLAGYLDGIEPLYPTASLQTRTRRTISNLETLKSEIDKVRHDGWALDDEEYEDGARCIAAPVFDHTGDIVAAVSVSGPVSRFSDALTVELAAEVRSAGRQISVALGSRGSYQMRWGRQAGPSDTGTPRV